MNLSSHRRMEKNIHLSPMRLFFFFFRKIIFESTIAQRYCTTNPGRGRRLRAILFPKEKEGERERACNVFINEIEGKLSDGKQRESDERCVGAGNRRSPASNSGRICTSKRRDNDFPPLYHPMLIYFAFYIFPRVSPSPHEHLAKTIPAGSTYGSKLHSVGRAPPENTINHFSLRFKTPGRGGGGGKKSWNFLRKFPSIARSLLLFLLSLRPGMQRATRERGREEGKERKRQPPPLRSVTKRY